MARRTTIVPPAAATTASADDGDAADSDLAIITRPTANILLEHHDMDLSPPHTSATARIARTLNPTPACAEASTTILYNPVGERQADDAVHPLSSLTYHMVLAVPDSPRPTLIRTYASNEAELLDALAAIERTPYSDNCVVTVILTADIELSESLQPRVPLMLQGRYIYVDDDGHGDTADHLRRPRLSISDARVVVVGMNLLTLMDLEVAQHSVRRDGFMCAVQVESQSTLTLVNCLVRASGAAVRARVGAQVVLRNCTLFGITSVCVDQPECVTACEDTCMMFYGVWPSQIVGRESMEPWPMLTQAGNMLQYVLPRLGDTLSVWPSSVWESGWALLLVSMAQSAGHLPVEHEEDAAVGLMLRGGDWELQALSDLVLLRLQMGEPTAPADLDEVQRREFLEVLQVVLRKQEVDTVEHGVGVEVDGGGEDDGGDDT